MIASERVSYGAAASEPTYDVLEMQDLRRGLDLLIENQCLIRFPGATCTS